MNALPTEPEALTIGQEIHEDGGLHFHVSIQYEKIQSFNPLLFDIEEGGKTYHPNVICMRTKRDYVHWSRYCVKEDPTPIIYDRVMMIIFNSKLGGLNNPWDLDSDSE